MTRITDIRRRAFNVSDKTNCFFVSVHTDEGCNGWGEASLIRREPALEAAVQRCAAECEGLSIEAAQARLSVDAASRRGLAANAAVSATQQALPGLQAEREGRPVRGSSSSRCS